MTGTGWAPPSVEDTSALGPDELTAEELAIIMYLVAGPRHGGKGDLADNRISPGLAQSTDKSHRLSSTWTRQQLIAGIRASMLLTWHQDSSSKQAVEECQTTSVEGCSSTFEIKVHASLSEHAGWLPISFRIGASSS